MLEVAGASYDPEDHLGSCTLTILVSGNACSLQLKMPAESDQISLRYFARATSGRTWQPRDLRSSTNCSCLLRPTHIKQAIKLVRHTL
jgi:hypothetical protein